MRGSQKSGMWVVPEPTPRPWVTPHGQVLPGVGAHTAVTAVMCRLTKNVASGFAPFQTSLSVVGEGY